MLPSAAPSPRSAAPGKPINPPAVDRNHISSAPLVPLGWRCGFCEQAAPQCQTTGSTHTWLTAGSRFPFCHEKEKTVQCPPPARFHSRSPVVLKQGTVLYPLPSQGTLVASGVVTTLGRGLAGIEAVRPGVLLNTPRCLEQSPSRERSGLERPTCQGRETLPQSDKIPLATASKSRSKHP